MLAFVINRLLIVLNYDSFTIGMSLIEITAAVVVAGGVYNFCKGLEFEVQGA